MQLLEHKKTTSLVKLCTISIGGFVMPMSFDIGLFVLSVFVIVLSFFTALVLTNAMAADGSRTMAPRIVLSGLAIGVGIWATYLISAIALNLPITLDVTSYTFFLPLLIAVVAVYLSLRIRFLGPRDLYSLLASCFVMNIGFNMTYAFAFNFACAECLQHISWPGFAALVVAGFLFSFFALGFAARRRGAFETFAGSIAIGGLAAFVNFIALKTFVAGSTAPATSGVEPILSHFYLALVLAGVAYITCSLGLIVHAAQVLPELEYSGQKALLEDKTQ